MTENKIITNLYEHFKPQILKFWENRTEVEIKTQKIILDNLKIESDNKYIYFLVKFEGTLYIERLSNDTVIGSIKANRESHLIEHLMESMTNQIMLDVFEQNKKCNSKKTIKIWKKWPKIKLI